MVKNEQFFNFFVFCYFWISWQQQCRALFPRPKTNPGVVDKITKEEIRAFLKATQPISLHSVANNAANAVRAALQFHRIRNSLISLFNENIKDSRIKAILITPEKLHKLSDAEIIVWIELSELQMQCSSVSSFYEKAFCHIVKTAKDRKKLVEKLSTSNPTHFSRLVNEMKTDVNYRITQAWWLWRVLSWTYKTRAVKIAGGWLFDEWFFA